ncbi:MAG: peptidoglycan DD-metalloendopeptidase family protein [Candidatus Omnitrophota bacterium]
MRCIPFVFAVFLGFLPIVPALAQTPKTHDDAQALRKRLEEERLKIRSLEQKKRTLEQTIDSEKQSLKRYDRILRDYQYNLKEAQKVIDAADSEVQQITERSQTWESFYRKCVRAASSHSFLLTAEPFSRRLQRNAIQEAGEDIARALFRNVQTEQPRLQELLTVIQDKRELQERILNRYMPVDLSAKETKEQRIGEKVEEAEKTNSDYQERLLSIEELQRQLTAWEDRIAEINRKRMLEEKKKREEQAHLLAERKKREEQQRLLAQQPAKVNPQNPAEKKISAPKENAPPPESSPAVSSGRPFSQQQGNLPWPAKGAVIRPFGEYAYPQSNITMKSPGIDVRVQAGTPIKAVAEGEVLYAGDIPGFGQTVILAHEGNYLTVYGRVAETVSVNQSVSAGQVIGKAMGMENQTDYHFEIRQGKTALNPLQWLSR